MSIACHARALLAAALFASTSSAQCPERWQLFDGTQLIAPNYGLGTGEEFGVRVDSIPAAHFPIEIIAIGVGWTGSPTPNGSVHVYATGSPTIDDVPLYSAPSPTVHAGLNRVDVTESGPF